MASDLEECSTYVQAIDEFAFSKTLFTWTVPSIPSNQTEVTINSTWFPVESPHGPSDAVCMILQQNEDELFIWFRFRKRKNKIYLVARPYRLHVCVIDDCKVLVEEIRITNSFCDFRAPMPKLKELLRTKQLELITFDCCIQVLKHPDKTMAEKVEAGETRKQIEQQSLKSLGENLYRQFLEKNMTNTTLKCQGRDIEAHKFILMSRWPAIVDKMASDSSVIDIADTSAEIVEELLKFVYSGTCDEADKVKIKQVLSVAAKHGLDELCEHLCKNLLELNSLSEKHSASSGLPSPALSAINTSAPGNTAPAADAIASKVLRILYESGPNNRFQQTTIDNVHFTWEIDCSGDFVEPCTIASKQFPLNALTECAYLEIEKEESKWALYLNGSRSYTYTKICADVSISGTLIESISVFIDNTSAYTYSGRYCVMELPKLSEKLNEKDENLERVTVTCRFQTCYAEPSAYDQPITPTSSQSTKNVGADIYKSLLNKSGVDVKLIAKGEEFEAHKLILCARSAVFAAMFHSGLTEQLTNTVHISDIDGKVLTQLLKFIYTATTDDLSDPTFTVQLLFAADKYDLQDLKALCEIQLCMEVTAENVLDMLLLAHQHSLTSLEKKALTVVRWNYKDLKDTAVYNAFASQNEDISVKIYTYLMGFLELKQE